MLGPADRKQSETRKRFLGSMTPHAAYFIENREAADSKYLDSNDLESNAVSACILWWHVRSGTGACFNRIAPTRPPDV